MNSEAILNTVLILCAVIAVAYLFRIFSEVMRPGGGAPARKSAPISQEAPVLRTESKRPGLQSDILKEGTGPGAKNGDHLTVHYTAYLPTGEAVDSSYDRKAPVGFVLGSRKMIDGWEVALVGVKEGESRRVTVPSKLAYGRNGSPTGKVPPNTDVIFQIDVVKLVVE